MHKEIQANNWQVFTTGDPPRASAVYTCIHSIIYFLQIKSQYFRFVKEKNNIETSAHLHNISIICLECNVVQQVISTQFLQVKLVAFRIKPSVNVIV